MTQVKYDDFLGDTINTNKWDSLIVGSGCQQYLENGFLVLYNDSTGETKNILHTKKTDWGKGIYRTRVKPYSGDGTTATQLTLFKAPLGTDGLSDEMAILKINGQTGEVVANVRVGGAWGTEQTLATVTLGQFYILEIEVTDSAITFRVYDDNGNKLGEYSETSNLPNFGFPDPVFAVALQNGLTSSGGVQRGDFDYLEVPSEYLPATFNITSYPSSVSGSPSETKTVSITIENIGGSDGDCTVRIKDHNNNIVAEQTKTITAGGSATYSLNITLPSSSGTYTWTIEAYNVTNDTIDDTKSFTVEVSEAPTPTKKKGVSPWVWLILIFVGVAVAWKWQEQKQEQQPSS